MYGFDFETNEYSDDDDNYDPYDDIANGRISKCKYGSYIGVAGYCCHKCFLEQKTFRENLRENFIKNLFEGYYQNEKENYIFKNEDVPNINDDWQTLKLIPPKTLGEIKKQYRKLAKKLHPDKPSGNHTKFIELNTAYNNLISIQS